MNSVYSNKVIKQVVKQIIQETFKSIKLKKMVKQNLPIYSSIKVLKFINQPFNTADLNHQTIIQFTNQQKQPFALKSDCLLPISVDIYSQNQYKKKLQQFNKYTAAMNQNQNNSKLFKQQKKVSSFIQLNTKQFQIQYVMDDGIIIELRKGKQQVSKKKQAQQKRKRQLLQEQAKQAKNKKQKGKQQKISFDFNGNVIKVKNDPKTNLINQLLKPNASKQALKSKQINKKSQLTQIASKSPKKDNNKKTRKLQQIQFSQVKSLLQDVAISKGSKLKQDKVTIQDKKKKLSLAQIKSSLSISRISKQDYNRLRQAAGSTQNREYSITNKEQSSKQQNQNALKKRSQSQANLVKNLKGTITINNQTLRDLYLTKALTAHIQVPQIPKSKTQLQEEEEAKKPQLDDNDRYNLGYLKGNSFKKGSQTSRTTILKLPRLSVHSKNMEVNQPNIPKNRQKLKQSSLIRRQLRKKFEDKLRI